MILIYILLIITFILILVNWKGGVTGKPYKSKLKYLVTNELAELCNKTKDPDNNIMIMMFTRGHIEEAKNCIYSYHKSTGNNNVLVFALDKQTKGEMDRVGISCYYNSNFYEGDITESNFMTEQFDIICYNKILTIYSALLQGVNVLWSDTDIVYFKDPFKKLNSIHKPISIQNNTNQEHIKNKLCAGFMFFKNQEQSKVFLQECIDYVDKDYDRLIVSKSDADQGVINKFNDPDIISVLSIEEFPNGIVWWSEDIPRINKSKAYMVHNNWIIGLDNKVKRFKESGLWFI